MPDLLNRLKTALSDRYAIERELGRGGMATVYLAEDLKHKRKVAIKVLHPELAATLGPERFLREIEIAAGLQHPHILGLLDSGQADGFLYYVMPALEGHSLRDRLNRETQLPVEDAIQITRAAASALDYAHRHQVIHRDIKPENILLHDGQPMVADFGIALAVTAAGGSRLTETGFAVGTPQYMSPEQAAGDRNVDGRSDIYSLACVLFEMLTGEPPHTGPTVQAIVAKILTQNVSHVTARRPSVPFPVELAMEKALARIPADRFATAGQFATALSTNGPTARDPVRPASWNGAALLDAARRHRVSLGLVAGSLTLSGFLALGRVAPERLPVTYAVTMPPGVEALSVNDGSPPLALSPDGRMLAFLGFDGHVSRIYLKRADRLDATPLQGTEGASGPFFSSDGKWVGFFSADGVNARVQKVSVESGTPIPVVELRSPTPRGADWPTPDAIVLASRNNRGLERLSVTTGKMVTVSVRDTSSGELSHRYPSVLPDETGVLFTAISARPGSDQTSVVGLDLRSGKTHLLVADGTTPRFVEPGYLVYARLDGSLLAAPFDARRLVFRATPASFLTDLSVSGGSGFVSFAVSRNGTLAYLRGTGGRKLVIASNDGLLRDTLPISGALSRVRISPDGRRAAVIVGKPMYDDIWIYDFRSQAFNRLTAEFGVSRVTWFPDGKRLLYTRYQVLTDSSQYGLYAVDADGLTAPEQIADGSWSEWSAAFSPDGAQIVIDHRDSAGGLDLWALDPRGKSPPRPVLQAPFDQHQPAISLDGQWLAYISNEGGSNEVYVRPLNGGPRVQVSKGGGAEPRWTSGGKLFYRTDQRVMVATLSAGQVIARRPFVEGRSVTRFDPFPQGDRVVVNVPADASPPIVVIVNWIAEVERRFGNTH